ncbi:N-acetylglucosamine-6-phosphate deacetylase [Geodermatophilus sabuli]|uniref:N-acetylglucosamine 6-phosphate deacetylase n=1 Tax=Geodermatophilus sabuli TaxID=1564158 RepID=A0A285EFN1_9ACTN|nr:amidohydrolase family protein [Geodermatophilus sabuli]MBB3086685.1 N-acetylglucosamine-6-phosphate deacetylase [Geodermatophilus sabuli]SNX97663.1 N-acetylglucosamine 6-phosphate deacetylase [Geodermatophilus sabuli]
MGSLLLTGGDVVPPGGVLAGGWVHATGPRLTAVGTGPAPAADRVTDCTGRTLVPGFVDVHQHGGGGASYDGGPDAARHALAVHRAAGTTTVVASLVSLRRGALDRALDDLTGLVADGELAGVHLEGPWLAPSRCGAHDPAALRPPTPAELARVLAPGIVRMVTLAPELPGALEAIAALAGAGVVPAVGHTEAAYGVVRAAVDAGARVATHLLNAMPAPAGREPGPVLPLLEDPRVTVELIADGVHLHPAWERHVLATAGPERVALVTDAMAAAGMPDGAYELGGLAVTVDGGVARLTGGGTLAGGTATSARLFRRAVSELGLSLADAARVTATTPAAALGLADVGALTAGRRADVVLLDGNWDVRGVLRAGEWVVPPS